jgi:hypothetical protein
MKELDGMSLSRWRRTNPNDPSSPAWFGWKYFGGVPAWVVSRPMYRSIEMELWNQERVQEEEQRQMGERQMVVEAQQRREQERLDRLRELVAQYGPEVVTTLMRKYVDPEFSLPAECVQEEEGCQ